MAPMNDIRSGSRDSPKYTVIDMGRREGGAGEQTTDTMSELPSKAIVLNNEAGAARSSSDATPTGLIAYYNILLNVENSLL